MAEQKEQKPVKYVLMANAAPVKAWFTKEPAIAAAHTLRNLGDATAYVQPIVCNNPGDNCCVKHILVEG